MILDKILNIADKAASSLIPDKNMQAKFRQAFRLKLLEYSLQERDLMQKFFLEYEGRATEIPRWVLILRALIRPLFTYLYGILGGLWIIGYMTRLINEPPPEALVIWNGIVMTFWFGSRYYEKKINKE